METRWHTREEQSENSKRHSEKKWYSTTTYSPAKEVSPSTAQLQLLKTFYLKQGALVSMETALRDSKAQERPKGRARGEAVQKGTTPRVATSACKAVICQENKGKKKEERACPRENQLLRSIKLLAL